MKTTVQIPLTPTPEQHRRLVSLQQVFAQVCNAIAPVVQETRSWNRVALHHLTYRRLRQEFPDLGSQMVCNAIYSVSRAGRLVFQSPGSPFHINRMQGQPLPRLHFTVDCPVYFDRHTLSLKGGQASMYTLDGRMRFQLSLPPETEQAFHQRKLLEVSLTRRAEQFVLSFSFGDADPLPENPGSALPESLVAASPEALASDEPQPADPHSPLPTEATFMASSLPAYLSVEVSA